jgi:hypothetical protein
MNLLTDRTDHAARAQFQGGEYLRTDSLTANYRCRENNCGPAAERFLFGPLSD